MDPKAPKEALSARDAWHALQCTYSDPTKQLFELDTGAMAADALATICIDWRDEDASPQDIIRSVQVSMGTFSFEMPGVELERYTQSGLSSLPLIRDFVLTRKQRISVILNLTPDEQRPMLPWSTWCAHLDATGLPNPLLELVLGYYGSFVPQVAPDVIAKVTKLSLTFLKLREDRCSYKNLRFITCSARFLLAKTNTYPVTHWSGCCVSVDVCVHGARHFWNEQECLRYVNSINLRINGIEMFSQYECSARFLMQRSREMQNDCLPPCGRQAASFRYIFCPLNHAYDDLVQTHIFGSALNLDCADSICFYIKWNVTPPSDTELHFRCTSIAPIPCTCGQHLHLSRLGVSDSEFY